MVIVVLSLRWKDIGVDVMVAKTYTMADILAACVVSAYI